MTRAASRSVKRRMASASMASLPRIESITWRALYADMRTYLHLGPRAGTLAGLVGAADGRPRWS